MRWCGLTAACEEGGVVHCCYVSLTLNRETASLSLWNEALCREL